jgi:hypothetical protein
MSVLTTPVLSTLKELSSIYFYWHVSLENLIESDVYWSWISLLGHRNLFVGLLHAKDV